MSLRSEVGSKATGELIRQVEEDYSVDKQHSCVTGFIMGRAVAWALAAKEPTRFAAVSPVCGRGSQEDARLFARVPAWVFHDAKNRTVPLR
jgi:predicted peptidase